MSRPVAICLSCLFIIVSARPAAAGVDGHLAFKFSPHAFLAADGIKDFWVHQPGTLTEVEETGDDNGCYLPTMELAAGLEMGLITIDLAGNLGYLHHYMFDGYMASGALGVSLVKEEKGLYRLALRPYGGPVRFSEIKWTTDTGLFDGNPELVFGSSKGHHFGMSMSAALRHMGVRLDFAKYQVSDAPIKQLKPGWRASRQSINLSGSYFGMSIFCHF